MQTSHHTGQNFSKFVLKYFKMTFLLNNQHISKSNLKIYYYFIKNSKKKKNGLISNIIPGVTQSGYSCRVKLISHFIRPGYVLWKGLHQSGRKIFNKMSFLAESADIDLIYNPSCIEFKVVFFFVFFC